MSLPDTITIDGVRYSRDEEPVRPMKKIDWSQVADIVPVKVSRENGLSAMILYPALSDTGYPDTKIWSKRSLITGIWVPWFGGECPLPEGVECMALNRGPNDIAVDRFVKSSNEWRWENTGGNSDIIAFRVTGIAQGWVE